MDLPPAAAPPLCQVPSPAHCTVASTGDRPYHAAMVEAPGEPTGSSRSAAQWLSDVRHAERRGELLAAFDLAGRGLDEHPGDVELRYRSVLALARAGST